MLTLTDVLGLHDLLILSVSQDSSVLLIEGWLWPHLMIRDVVCSGLQLAGEYLFDWSMSVIWDG